MVKCPNCGEESESNFCPNCGEKLEVEITCPHCQAKIEAGSLFCSECGEKIETDEKEEDKKTPDKEDTIEKKETDEKTPDKEDTIEKKETDEKDKNEEKKSSDNNETSNKEDKNAKYCPHCSEKLDEDGAIFCSNCGKMVEVDEYSFNGIIQSIKFKRLIIVSLLGFVVTFVVGIILSFVAGAIGSQSITYPVFLIIALFIGVGFFASFFKDILNSGLCGIIIGLLFGILANTAVEISTGFAYSYTIFSGYEIAIFTVLGLIFALIANKLLRNIVLKYVNADNIF